MSEPSASRFALRGLESDNLLAFLALLGLLRSIGAVRPGWSPRAWWKGPPWEAWLQVDEEASEQGIVEAADAGILELTSAFDVDDRNDVSFTAVEFRRYLSRMAGDSVGQLLASALAAEYPARNDSNKITTAPLVMMFGQGHQHYLSRLRSVPLQRDPAGDDTASAAARTLNQALFAPWRRQDSTDAFRWDPEEDQRYALRFGNPSRAGAAPTVHGANRLAVLGTLSFAVAPGQKELGAPGFVLLERIPHFVWPIWREPLSLSGIEALLSHPAVLSGKVVDVEALGVTEIMRARRVSNGKFMNVARAAPARPD